MSLNGCYQNNTQKSTKKAAKDFQLQFRGGVRTGATGAIAPVDFCNFNKIQSK